MIDFPTAYGIALLVVLAVLTVVVLLLWISNRHGD